MAKKKKASNPIPYPMWWSSRPPIIVGWRRLDPAEKIRALDKWAGLNNTRVVPGPMDKRHIGHTQWEMWGLTSIYHDLWVKEKRLFASRWYVYRRVKNWKKPVYLSPYFAIPSPLP